MEDGCAVTRSSCWEAAGKLPRNFQRLAMHMSLPNFARLQYITTYMDEYCEIISIVVGTSCNRNLMYRNELMAFFTDEITVRVTIRQN